MGKFLFNVAIHHLLRSDKTYKILSGNSNIAITATTERIINQLHLLYTRQKSKSYGKFSELRQTPQTLTDLTKYIYEETDFNRFTLSLMATLQKQSSHKSASTGGHVLFAHYEKDNIQYVLIAIITDKLSAALTQTNDLKDVEHLDLEGFRFAGRINLAGWGRSENRYISFLKGKGAVSDYFKEFLGCDTTIENREETTSLVKALKAFADKHKTDQLDRKNFLEKALGICDREARAKKEIEFTALANELYPNEPDVLTGFLSEAELNDGFLPDRRALKSLVGFKGKTKEWAVQFERDALHTGKVHYNRTDNTLTLYDVPTDLSSELTEEMYDDRTPSLA